MNRFIVRTLVPVDVLAAALSAIPAGEEPDIRIEGDRAIGVFSSGLRTEITAEAAGGFSVLLKTFDIYGPDGTHLFSMPNFNLTQKQFDLNPGQSLLDYYAQFDGVTLEYSDGDDTVRGDEFFTGGVSSALNSTSALAGILLRQLAEESLIIHFGDGTDTMAIDEARGQTVPRVVNDSWVNVYMADNSRIETYDLERLELTDGTFVFDVDGAYADYTYAVYSAALARRPDEEGLRFWNGVANSDTYQLHSREATEERLAGEFVNSVEFQQRFDVNTVNGFITALYENVLDRAPDQGGFDFWTAAFETGDLGRNDMLRMFTVSDENMNAIAADIEHGYWVT